MRFLCALVVSVVAISLATPHAVAESKGDKSNVALTCSAIDKRPLTDALITQRKNDVIASCTECNDVKVRVNFSITKPKARLPRGTALRT